MPEGQLENTRMNIIECNSDNYRIHKYILQNAKLKIIFRMQEGMYII